MYKDLTQGADVDLLEKVDLRQGEDLIGVYENNPGYTDDAVIVTNLGLHLRRKGGWTFIGYDEIRAQEVPSGDKHKVDSLLITLADGKEERIPIRGGRGRFRDVFEFLRFLDRVSEDRRRQA